MLELLTRFLPLIKDIVLICTGGVAVYVGLRGLDAWRRQLYGQTEYDLGKRILRSTYRVREAIHGVRHPFLQYSRDPDLPEDKLKKLSDKEKEWHALAQAYQKRWQPLSDAKAELDAELLEAEAVWGVEIREKFGSLDGLITELFLAIEYYLDVRNPNVQEEWTPEERKESREIMYARGSKDKFKGRLDAVLKDIEAVLKPHIARR